MLINGLPLLSLIKTERLVFIGGRTGSGKTALAFRLAYELLRSGFSRYLLTNVPCVWADAPEDVRLRDGQYLDVCLVLDEAGQYLKLRGDLDPFISAMRKLNVVLILPSHHEVPRLATRLTVELIVDLSLVGVPLWLYGVRYRVGRKYDKYWLWWWRPSEVFGVYDTQYYATSDAGLGLWMVKQQKALANAGGTYVGVRGYRPRPEESGGVVGDDGGSIWDGPALTELIASVNDLVDAMAEVSERAPERKRRRWFW